jgi:hypothetical protein
MKRAIWTAVILGVATTVLWAAQGTTSATPAPAAADGPQYSKGTNLIRPANYREWVFLGAGLDMTYQPPDARGRQTFSNVFVNPSAYRGFMQTGKWPDQSSFVLEIRAAGSEGAINGNTTARYQTGVVALEAEVKDSRFPDGWAFFDFGRGTSADTVSEPLAGERVARCIECHTKHTAVERTFVQFYPTLLEVARKMGTVKPNF